VAEQEVNKLIQAKFIWDVHYTTCLANVLFVKKGNNRRCARIILTSTRNVRRTYTLEHQPFCNKGTQHKILNIFDAYLGYNQICIHLQVKEKTTLITETINYYYEVMPFSLKNVSTRYECLMDKISQQ